MAKKKGTKINWKKIILVVLGAIVGLIIVVIIGFLIWFSTWKTYEFPDGSGYLIYPNDWYLSSTSIRGKTEWVFGTLYNLDEANAETINPLDNTVLNFSSFPLDGDKNSLEDIDRMALTISEQGKKNKPILKKIDISGKPFYLVEDRTGIRTYLGIVNNSKYVMGSYFLDQHFGIDFIFNRLVLDLVIASIKFY